MSFIPFDIKCYTRLYERFSYLFEEELINEICQYGTVYKFEEDDIVMDVGDTITHFPIVIEGSIKVLTEDEDGNELFLYHLEMGDTCAVTLNCCTRSTKSNVRAVAENHLEVLFIDTKKLDEWMVKYATWRNFVLESYNDRLNEMVKAIDLLVFHSLEERLEKYLRDKAWITKKATLNISHKDIANDLHSSRVVISRLMKNLENKGVIKQGRNKVEFMEFSSSKN